MWRRKTRGRIRSWKIRAKNKQVTAYNEAGVNLSAWQYGTSFGQKYLWPYLAIVKGTDTGNRIGDRIKATGLVLKLKLYLSAAYYNEMQNTPRTAQVRIIVGSIKNNVNVTVTNFNQMNYFLFTDNGPGVWNAAAGYRDLTNTHYARNGNMANVRIISDKVYTLNCATGSVRSITKKLKLRGDVHFPVDIIGNDVATQVWKGQYFIGLTADMPISDNGVYPVQCTFEYRAYFDP